MAFVGVGFPEAIAAVYAHGLVTKSARSKPAPS
jgi:hypothetical protein